MDNSQIEEDDRDAVDDSDDEGECDDLHHNPEAELDEYPLEEVGTMLNYDDVDYNDHDVDDDGGDDDGGVLC